MILICGIVFILLFISFVVYSQNNTQKEKQITQAEFVDILIKVLGLEDQLPISETLSDKVKLLKKLGYEPLGGWQLDRVLTKGDAAVVIAKILSINGLDSKAEDYVQALAERGIMTTGDVDLPFSESNLVTSINTAAAIPGAFPPGVQLQPYHLPLSPVY
jgi:hypothetical protein